MWRECPPSVTAMFVGHTPFYVQCKENTSNSIYYTLSGDALLRLKGLKKGRVEQEKKVHFWKVFDFRKPSPSDSLTSSPLQTFLLFFWKWLCFFGGKKLLALNEGDIKISRETVFKSQSASALSPHINQKQSALVKTKGKSYSHCLPFCAKSRAYVRELR